MKKVMVISLGGSLIIPDDVSYKFLKEFKRVIEKHSDKYKFVVVCGGGSVARKYIRALSESGANNDFQSFAGISATRMNARFVSYFFGYDPDRGIPHTLHTLKKYLKKRNVVFCGALEYKPNQTSDSTAAGIAASFGSSFVNLSNVAGLFDKNPTENKGAKLIPYVSWEDFVTIANKIKFKPGQHFILDQVAARIIRDNKVETYLIGNDMKQFSNFLNGKRFIGSIIGE
jgi:uridylate kinase